MSDHRPAPLVPADVDITGLDGFMLNVQRLFSSELWALATGEEFKAALGLWGRAWQQTPPGSLPNDERLLAAFSGAGARWKKVRGMALRGFVLCSDGRLYHKVLCEDVLTAWDRRKEFSDGNRNRNDRQTRWRERVRDLSAKLREAGITPPAGASLRTLERLLRDAHVDASVDTTVDAPVDGPEASLSMPSRLLRQDSDRDIANLKPPSPTIRGAGPIGRSELDHVERACRNALGDLAPADAVIGPMALIAERFSLQRVIITLQSEARRPRRSAVRTWRLWADIVEQQLAQNTLPVTSPGPKTKLDLGGQFSEIPLANVPGIVKTFEDRGHWPYPTPRPGEPGCRIPAELLPDKYRSADRADTSSEVA